MMAQVEITRMLRFGSKWAVKLSCGHSFDAPGVTILRQQLFIGKTCECVACKDALRTRRKATTKESA